MLQSLDFSGKKRSLDNPLIMGILNVTADSFYDGGQYQTEEAVINRIQTMLDEGADLIDIGAVSTRPNALDIPENEEITAIQNTITLIRKHFPNTILSIDTWRASVAETALANGANMINDISGGTFDDQMIPLIGQSQVPYCMMHTSAKPERMQQCTHYDNILQDMLHFFKQQLDKLYAVNAHQILIDPGFGFGKTLEQNYFIMKNLEAFHVFELPLFVGISRKSMIYKLLGTSPQEALNGTTALNTFALMHGAKVLRVHDVKAAVEARTICMALLQA